MFWLPQFYNLFFFFSSPPPRPVFWLWIVVPQSSWYIQCTCIFLTLRIINPCNLDRFYPGSSLSPCLDHAPDHTCCLSYTSRWLSCAIGLALVSLSAISGEQLIVWWKCWLGKRISTQWSVISHIIIMLWLFPTLLGCCHRGCHRHCLLSYSIYYIKVWVKVTFLWNGITIWQSGETGGVSVCTYNMCEGLTSGLVVIGAWECRVPLVPVSSCWPVWWYPWTSETVV